MDEDTKKLFEQFNESMKAIQNKNNTNQQTLQIDFEKELKNIHKNTSKSKTLIIHVRSSLHNQVGQVKTKIYKQDFTWKQRLFPIMQDAIWYDLKGVGHALCDANMSDGTIRFYTPAQMNLIDTSVRCDKCNRLAPIDKCAKCGDTISYDASAVFNMHRRKTLTTFWGLDQSHIVLLLILGIIAIGGFAGIMYEIGQNGDKDKQIARQITINTDLQNKLNEYLPPIQPDIPNGDNTP